ncbi:MAG: HU family DNA-binding protein [Clostridia bacterium]|nr:HU family DNA-binding protein [Clostridia bacterium]
MNKTELCAALAAKTGFTKKDAGKCAEALFDAITEALCQGEKVQLMGFGTFEVRNRPARTARNPRTGETVKVPASKAPAFKAGKALKDSI